MPTIQEDYVSVDKAAELLKVSKSTLWRWITLGDLPAYRFGRRRVLIKRKDLDRLITPTHKEKGGRMTTAEQDTLGPLTETEQKSGLAALAKLRALQEEMLGRRKGMLFASSSEDLHELREQRTRELQ